MSNKNIFGENKLYDHTDKLSHFLNKNKTLITAELDLTNKCNNKCPHCAGFNDNKVSLTYEEACDYVDQLAEAGCQGIVLTGGGSPTCHKDWFKIIEHIKSKNIDVGFITNGLKSWGDAVIYKRVLEACTWIRFSLDAGTPEVYKQTHGMDEKCFNKVKGTINTTTNFKWFMPNNKPTIGTGFLTGENTRHDMLNFAKLSKELGVDYAQFRPLHGDFTDVSKEIEECKKLETDTFKIVASTQKYEMFGDLERPYDKCYGANFRVAIAADGCAYTCCHTKSKKEFLLGNLKEEKFSEIWKRRQEMIDKIDVQKCRPYFCIMDKMNRELHNMLKEREHRSFL